MRVKFWTHLYKLGASLEEEWPPNIQTFPTTNHIAKKQSNAILNLSTRVPTLPHINSMSALCHFTFSYKSSITTNRLGIPPDERAPRRETANASQTMSLQASILIVAKSATGTTA